MLFKQVVGQEALKQKLRDSVKNGRVAHAQMLVGPVGSGPLPLALAFAQYLGCKNRTETDSCGACESCKRYAKLEHPDLQLIFPKNKTQKIDSKTYSSKDFVLDWRAAVLKNPYLNLNSWLKQLGIENKQGLINVDDSREVLQNLSYKAYEAEYRVVLIWLAEYMNAAAANKILKILEEPPERTVFLLVAEGTENLLQTILSRVQIHRLGRLSEEEIAQALPETDGGSERAQQLAHLADGDLNLAKQLLEDQTVVTDSIGFFIRWMRACFAVNMEMLRDLTDEFQSLGREQQKATLQQSGSILRKVLMYRTLPETKAKLLREELEFVHKFSQFITQDNAAEMLAALDEAYYHIERNANPKITFTDLSFQLSEKVLSAAIK
ncbi:MAG: DNA polymerase III subunit delta' [Flavobacteriales bacterium]|nr:DNA polymerase III subunit delta' [Flavobacteriales bacterium]